MGLAWGLTSKKKKTGMLIVPSSFAWGGGTPLYQVYRYVLPQRVWFLSRFGVKLGMVIGRTFAKA